MRQDLDRSVIRPAGWEDLHPDKYGYLSSSPKSKWGVVRGDKLKLLIYLAWPVRDKNDDEDPWVGLSVPGNWRKLKQFAEGLKAPQGFEHIRDHPEWFPEYPISKSIPYEDLVRSDGSSDSVRFLEELREAAATLVAWEKNIDVALERAKSK